MKELDADLDHSFPGSIKDLILTFPLSYKERCIVMNSKLPSRAFFKNLLKTKVELPIRDLQIDLEKNSTFPNKIIFKKINKDLKEGVQSFSVDSKLGDFPKDSQVHLYIMENIADNLMPEEQTLLPTWKNIASHHGYSSQNILSFCNVQSTVTKVERLLSLICEKEPSLPISLFIDKLILIERNDIVGKVEKWRDSKVVSICVSSKLKPIISYVFQ